MQCQVGYVYVCQIMICGEADLCAQEEVEGWSKREGMTMITRVVMCVLLVRGRKNPAVERKKLRKKTQFLSVRLKRPS